MRLVEFVRCFRHGYLLALAIAFTAPALAQVAAPSQPPAAVPNAVPAPSTGLPRVRFSLDGRTEGPAAMFLLPQQRGYFKAAGVEAVIDEAANPIEAITRVASGAADMGFADINAMIRHRDQHPANTPKAVFMVYNKPPYAIVTRKSRGITEPKQLEGKKLGAPPSGTTVGEWTLFAKLNGIDTAKVTVENIAIPVRAPMLAAGQIDLVIETEIKPHDIVPLIPIIAGAGGIVTTWENGPAQEGGRIVAAGDKRVHAAALEMLKG